MSNILIAAILDSRNVVINKGANDGIEHGDRYRIIHFGEAIFDPVTKESLGRVEVPKGTGHIISVQQRMAILQASSGMFSSSSAPPPSFNNPLIGDTVVKL